MSGIHLKGGGGSGHEASVEGAYGNQATDDAQTSLSKTGKQCSAHFIETSAHTLANHIMPIIDWERNFWALLIPRT